MAELILHHYAMSPFSEKIRAMLGYTDQAWQSVTVREFPPRPHLDQLTGGYRKIPVAQQGADVFCDTRIITSELANLCGRPELAVEGCGPEEKEFVARADLEVFLACVLSADGRTLLKKMRRDHSWFHIGRFLWDRINMGRKARVKAAGPGKAPAVVREHLERMESMLDTNYLFGDTPNIADFAAWHGLWFVRELSESGLVSPFPRVNAWMDRMRAFGHGRRSEIDAGDALDQARHSEPRPLPENAPGETASTGQRVRITPSDYGREGVTGELVAVTDHRWILARTPGEGGTLHVHFPRDGFTLKNL
jgi:glutathione S-transferase